MFQSFPPTVFVLTGPATAETEEGGRIRYPSGARFVMDLFSLGYRPLDRGTRRSMGERYDGAVRLSAKAPLANPISERKYLLFLGGLHVVPHLGNRHQADWADINGFMVTYDGERYRFDPNRRRDY